MHIQSMHRLSVTTKRAYWLRLIVVGILMWGGTVLASAEVVLPAGEPVTLRGRFTVGALSDGGYSLAGLAATPDGPPDVLQLTWAQVPAGWFGSVWGLQLTSAQGVIPPNMSQPGTDFLAGSQYINLLNHTPQPGHTYELALTYDPGTGSAGVALFDVTENSNLVERGMQLLPYEGILAPTFGYEAGPELSWSATQTDDTFYPVGLSWRLVRSDPQGVFHSIEAVDRRETVHVHVWMPWEQLPGIIDIWLYDGSEKIRIGSISQLTDGAMASLALAGQPAGEYQVIVEYVTDGKRSEFGARTVRVGLVQARLVDTEVTRAGPRSIEVRGHLVVSGDGPIPHVTVGLDAALDRVVLIPAQANQQRFSTHRDLSHSVLVEEIRNLTEDPIHIPFATTLDISSDVEWPYRVWHVLMEPTTDSPFGSEIAAFRETVRIYAEQSRPSDGPLRVMTYNIQHGAGMDGEIDLQRLADVIAYSGADVIGLQEVDVRTQRSNGVDQAGTLAELLAMESAFGSTLPYRGGQYGNAVLSRYPIVSSHNIRLPLIGGETRGLLHAVVDVDGSPVSFYVTHLSLYEDENVLQREDIIRRLASDERPFVLVGDFNMTPPRTADPRGILHPLVRDVWLEAARLSPHGSPLRTMTTLGNTFSSANPMRRIDYIFLSERLDLTDDQGVFLIQSLASDHLPLVAELQLKD